ncbi:pyridoxine 5'-phosphate synthase [Porticoccaceae bacterium]|nr:pyridoxine 5'-phosphate synthase [Porticoccaceae bacterium]MDB2566180.1 pyridoxine 5'-phosphate synthase [Porticoccaceae bacterium]MDB2620425.1 pyridoxine 5'-phosphate synthase [Porticoccaceae bacterium]MDB2669096.1 pyridoxine 5'-phosphate synthase [Porticoccaceae bacterium]MDC0523925.1 pyridoxine 5'-phosphate synthase [Porticoccaceae bacterium]
MTALSINLNKISLLRNSREGNYPNIVKHAKVCIDHGADGITVHPRPDQRHIRPKDVRDLAELVRPQPNLEFNVEGNPFAPALADYPGFLELVEETNPDQCTLVPDTDSQLTSDHGFDLHSSGEALYPIIQRLKNQGMRVSLFMDPDLEQIDLAAKVGADRIELYTGPYAASWGTDSLETIFQQHLKAAQLATSLGMGVNAGHDLNLDNLAKFSSIPNLLEVSIGHAFIVDSLSMGMASTVQAYKKLLSQN